MFLGVPCSWSHLCCSHVLFWKALECDRRRNYYWRNVAFWGSLSTFEEKLDWCCCCLKQVLHSPGPHLNLPRCTSRGYREWHLSFLLLLTHTHSLFCDAKCKWNMSRLKSKRSFIGFDFCSMHTQHPLIMLLHRIMFKIASVLSLNW